MPPKMRNASLSEENNITHDGTSFKATAILLPSHSLQNLLDPSYTQFLKEKKLVPGNAEIWIPKGSPVRMDWVSEEWFSIHEAFFRSGGMLPFSPLTTQVLQTLKLMPFQLMPAVWRLLHGIEAVCKKHNLEIRVEDLQNHYGLRSHGNGRFLFRVRDKMENLIGNLDSGEDKGWASYYMFVKKESMGTELGYLKFPLIKMISDWSAKVGDTESEARIEAFLSLSVEDRTWPQCVGEAALPHYSGGKADGKPPKAVAVIAGTSSTGGSKVSLSAVRAKLLKVKQERMEANKAGGKSEGPIMMREAQSGDSVQVIDKGQEVVSRDKEKKRKYEDENTSVPVLGFQPAISDGALACIGRDLIDCYAKHVPFSFNYKESPQQGAKLVGKMHETLQDMVAFCHAANVNYDYLEASQNQAADSVKKMESLEAELASEKTKVAASQAKNEELTKSVASLECQVQSLASLNEGMSKAHQEAMASLEVAAVVWFSKGRIATMRESEEQRASWDVEAEIEDFHMSFPNEVLEDEGEDGEHDKVEDGASKTVDAGQPNDDAPNEGESTHIK